jgi:hypothetical protein
MIWQATWEIMEKYLIKTSRNKSSTSNTTSNTTGNNTGTESSAANQPRAKSPRHNSAVPN